MVTVLLPTYKEGSLAASAIRSVLVPGVHHIVQFEGPVGDDAALSSPHDLMPSALMPPGVEFHSRIGRWKDDAAKRTAMLQYAQDYESEILDGRPLWILWLDGDEILLYGEYLADYVLRAEKTTGAGGFALRLVELDGSVSFTHNRIIRGENVKRYVHSIMTIELLSGLTVSLPNVQICAQGGVPMKIDGSKVELEDLATLRPPLMGEPHILHRSVLRDPNRVAVRQSDAEKQWFSDVTSNLA